MKNMQMKYPNTLREHRVTLGLTQKEVATLLGMQCEDRISHWENGQSMPSVTNFMKLCRIYRMQVEDVYSK